ncbi:16S rRNA (guanine(527)-N(7))-methyltransferase RsmG [Spiroplasma sp. DGKH1]|uniref:16S rRNA (guanine(527)-N(7))-methyltransferase RsmG n=1 Tax=Spiroplasma sp. DGKH1 TaxID=3050074 RepID=UPI0034C63757
MIEIITNVLPNLIISEDQQNQLKIYYDYLIAQNKVMNLTAITDEEEVYYKHFLDSLLLLKHYQISENSNICDVGSGAGFPGIVLKIINPHFKLTIIEALAKRCKFLTNLVTKLNLTNVTIIHARAEEYSYDHPETFDIILSRAVANLGMLLELTVRLAKVGGLLICYKGANIKAELAASQKTIAVLGLELIDLQYENIDHLGERNICYFKKRQPTNSKYPRHFSQIKKSPIG